MNLKLRYQFKFSHSWSLYTFVGGELYICCLSRRSITTWMTSIINLHSVFNTLASFCYFSVLSFYLESTLVYYRKANSIIWQTLFFHNTIRKKCFNAVFVLDRKKICYIFCLLFSTTTSGLYNYYYNFPFISSSVTNTDLISSTASWYLHWICISKVKF